MSAIVKKSVIHDAMAVAGYTAPWHVTAGGAVELHLSAEAAVRGVRLMRIDTPEPQVMDWPVRQLADAPRHESFDLGSFLRIGAAQLAGAGHVEGVSFAVFLTRNHGDRAIVETDSFSLTLTDDGLRFRLGDRLLLSGEPLPARDWLRIEIDLTFTPSTAACSRQRRSRSLSASAFSQSISRRARCAGSPGTSSARSPSCSPTSTTPRTRPVGTIRWLTPRSGTMAPRTKATGLTELSSRSASQGVWRSRKALASAQRPNFGTVSSGCPPCGSDSR